MNDDDKNVEEKELDRNLEEGQFRLSNEEQTRYNSEFETVKRGEGSPPIYGYLGVAAIIGLFFAKVFEADTKANITFILAALAAVNALVISAFSFSSLQLHELKQFQTSHSKPGGAESEWEFKWRRNSSNSITFCVRRWYYATLYLFLGAVSLFLIAASLAPTHRWRERWPACLAIVMHVLPCRLLIQEIWVANKRWKRIEKSLCDQVAHIESAIPQSTNEKHNIQSD